MSTCQWCEREYEGKLPPYASVNSARSCRCEMNDGRLRNPSNGRLIRTCMGMHMIVTIVRYEADGEDGVMYFADTEEGGVLGTVRKRDGGLIAAYHNGVEEEDLLYGGDLLEGYLAAMWSMQNGGSEAV